MRFSGRFSQGALLIALLVISACTRLPSTSSLLLGGDVILARGGEPLFTENGSAAFPWGEVTDIPLVIDTDIFAVNLESPFGVLPSGLTKADEQMNLCAPTNSVTVLREGGVNLVTSANNHAKDCIGTYEANMPPALLDAGIALVTSADPVYYDLDSGVRIAFFALNDYDSGYNLEDVKVGIREARMRSDLVVISLHWGSEYQAGPSAHQVTLAQDLVNAGVDVIWGHHPHVLQRMEWMTSTIDKHQALVIYSLGNLLSDQWMLEDALRSALVRIDFRDHKVKRITIIPLAMDMMTEVLWVAYDKPNVEWISNRLKIDKLDDHGVEIELWQPEH